MPEIITATTAEEFINTACQYGSAGYRGSEEGPALVVEIGGGRGGGLFGLSSGVAGDK